MNIYTHANIPVGLGLEAASFGGALIDFDNLLGITWGAAI